MEGMYDLLEEKRQFVSDYNIENVKNILLKMKNAYLNNEFKPLQDYSDFSLEKLTLKLEKLFI